MRFKQIIKKERYQVFLFVCPATMPFSFAIHPWFVINQAGLVSRWGVSMRRRRRELSFGHLNKNLLPPFQGIEIFPFSQKYFWSGKLIFSIEGDENSVAGKMAKFIEESNKNYPYKGRYSLLGPNSNTYVQWVLDYFPESGMSLPWNSFGNRKEE